MHRMRSSIVKAGLALLVLTLVDSRATADLIRQPAGSSYPDIAGAMDGTQTYTYNPTTQTGLFQLSNTPYLLMLGPKSSDEYTIEPNTDGTRKQSLSLTLDQNGRLVNSPGNSFSLYGSVVIGGQTFSGLLLQATPTAFGSQAGAAPAFDMSLAVTGGALAQAFGPDLYLQLHPSVDSTFDGSFNQSFSTSVECTTTLGPHSPVPGTIPEPTTFAILLVGGAAVFFHGRSRRIPARALGRLEKKGPPLEDR